MSAFSQYVRSTLEQAGREAQLDRATTIEAQHVLLAIAAQPELPAARVLSSVGLDRRVLRDALDRELAHSLGAAGVALDACRSPRALPSRRSTWAHR